MVKPVPKKSRVNENGDASPSEEPEPESLLAKYAGDFGHCELRACIANTGTDNKNAKLIMMNTSAIPCCAEKCRDDEKKSTPIKMTLLHVQAAGFSAAPYSVPFGGGKGKVGDNPKPLTAVEMVDDGVRRQALRMWPFKKESSPGNRGPRCEDKSFLLECGDSFVMFVSKMDFMKTPQYGGDNPNSLFPKGVEEIPAFSLLEVYVMSKPGDPTMNRDNVIVPRMSCVRFCMVRPCANSLYSYANSLAALPGSLEEAKKNAFAKRERFEIISKDLECDNVCFAVRAPARHATVSDQFLESDGIVSVVGWSEDPMDADVALDVPVEQLLKYTNGGSVQWSMTLLELALNLESVAFTVFSSDYFRRGEGLSHLRAVPVLNTRKMLDGVRLDAEHGQHEATPEGTLVTFDTGAPHRDEAGREQRVLLSVLLKPEYTALAGADLPSRDLVICARSFNAPKAHPFHFAVLAPGGEPQVVLRGYLRVDGSSGGGGVAHKRVRFGAADE